MTLDDLLDEQDLRFRDEVREFCARHLDPVTRDRVRSNEPLEKHDHVRWQRALASKGWLTTTWPVHDGGPGWSVVRHQLFEEEMYAAYAPPVALTLAVGPRLVGPILCQHGTAQQKQIFLPAIRQATVWWCQGYSEPEAGSDLASLRTTARRVDGGWRVSGQKTWTSYAHWADLMACLARTQPHVPAASGVSLLALDMRAPGVTVRPLRAANGRHFFNEVWIDDVFVPDSHVIGPVHGGWGLAKSLLEHERLNAARVAEIRAQLRRCQALLSSQGGSRSQHMAEAKLAELQASHRALDALVLRFVSQAAHGETVGPAASMLKVRGTELLQQVNDLLSDLLGPQPAIPWQLTYTDQGDREQMAHRHHAAQAFYARGFTVAAGTSEVQRNVLAREMLRESGQASFRDDPEFESLLQHLTQSLPRLLVGPASAQVAALAAAGWWWPPEEDLPLPRPALVCLVGLALGRHGAALPHSMAAGATAALEALPGDTAAQLLEALQRGEPGAVLVESNWPKPLEGGSPSESGPTITQQSWIPEATWLVVNTAAPADSGVDSEHKRAAIWLLPVPAPGTRLSTAAGLDGIEVARIEVTQGWEQGAVRLHMPGPAAHVAYQRGLGMARLASYAYAVGQMQALVEATVRHVSTRHQFGQKLAGFQAVQHRLADMHMATEEARALLHATARQLVHGLGAEVLAALGLVTIGAGRCVAQAAVQLHGAYALTAESGVGSRVIALEAALARHGSATGCATVLSHNLHRPIP